MNKDSLKVTDLEFKNSNSDKFLSINEEANNDIDDIDKEMKKDNVHIEEKTTEEIRKLFLTTATNEALQGFFKVLFSSKKTIKIFWISSLIVTNALNAYLIIESILAYLSYDVSTSSKYIAENPTLFPKITICKFEFFFNLLKN